MSCSRTARAWRATNRSLACTACGERRPPALAERTAGGYGAAGRGTATPGVEDHGHGPLWLAGGVTLPAFRGRGIYRALVRARWDDTVQLGAGALVVNAMVDTSYPILERLGFRAVGRVRLLADRSATIPTVPRR